MEAKGNPGFYCPITGDMMSDPVVDAEGNTYEKRAIEEWININHTSPITRNKIALSDLRPNRSLKQAIEEHLASYAAAPMRMDVPAKGDAVVTVPQLTLTINAMKATLNSTDTLCPPDCTDFLVHISTYSPPIPDRVPSDIVLVVDVSGSMGSDATATGVEHCGLTLLDIVKHAVKTVISTLTENDRLSIVSYSDSARVLFDLMAMNSTGKENAITLLDKLQPGGMTNLWDGLHTGLNILKNKSIICTTNTTNTTNTPNGTGNNSALLLLTDGEPNIEPPRGHLPMLKRYKDAMGGRYSGVISTFGFGYSLDSVLLRKIATDGGGMYSFIPDSGFVGTAFVNALANILSTVTADASLLLTFHPLSGASIGPEGVYGGLPHTFGPAGVIIPLGCVQTGQTKDVVVCVTLPQGPQGVYNAIGPKVDIFPIINASLSYTVNSSQPFLHVWEAKKLEGKEGKEENEKTEEVGKKEKREREEKVEDDDYEKIESLSREEMDEERNQEGCNEDEKSLGGKNTYMITELKRQQTILVVEKGPVVNRTNCMFTFEPLEVPRSAEEHLLIIQEIEAQYLRAQAVSCLLVVKHTSQPESQESVHQFHKRLIKWLGANSKGSHGGNRGLEQGSPYQRISGLSDDFEGQVFQATSRLDWFLKWGRHYLQSLMMSHSLQQCNNFKDPGVQFYGGDLFRSIRDYADDQFCNLPPPVPAPVNVADFAYYGQALPPSLPFGAPSGVSSSSPPLSMMSFNSPDQPCFHGQCVVLLANGVKKMVKHVRMGDILPGDDVITCVVRSDCAYRTARMVRIKSKPTPQWISPTGLTPTGFTPSQGVYPLRGLEDLLITPWHPVKIEGSWIYPHDLNSMKNEGGIEGVNEGGDVKCDAVYSFLIKKRNSQNGENGNNSSKYGSSMTVNGIQCVTLAHCISGDKTISHPFFGTLAVEEELKRCRGWDRGYVHFGLESSSRSVLESGSRSASDFYPTPLVTIVEPDNARPGEVHGEYNTCERTRVREGMSDRKYGCLLRDARTGLASGFDLLKEVFLSLENLDL